MLSILPERIADIIVAARACEAEEKEQLLSRHGGGRLMEEVDEDEDLGGLEVSPARQRLMKLIVSLRGTEFTQLLALAWLGRGDFEPAALPEALRQASNIISTHPTQYLANLPGLADYLESALISLGIGVSD
jgi:Protein of unknown function (DUF3775)